MSEYFKEDVSSIKAEVECLNGHLFDLDIYYEGVESTKETAVGTYQKHVWFNGRECPECHEDCEVKLVVLERRFKLESAYFENSNCEVLNKIDIGLEVGTKIREKKS